MATIPSASSGPPRSLTSDEVLAVVDLAWNGPIWAPWHRCQIVRLYTSQRRRIRLMRDPPSVTTQGSLPQMRSSPPRMVSIPDSKRRAMSSGCVPGPSRARFGYADISDIVDRRHAVPGCGLELEAGVPTCMRFCLCCAQRVMQDEEIALGDAFIGDLRLRKEGEGMVGKPQSVRADVPSSPEDHGDEDGSGDHGSAQLVNQRKHPLAPRPRRCRLNTRQGRVQHESEQLLTVPNMPVQR